VRRCRDILRPTLLAAVLWRAGEVTQKVDGRWAGLFDDTLARERLDQSVVFEEFEKPQEAEKEYCRTQNRDCCDEYSIDQQLSRDLGHVCC